MSALTKEKILWSYMHLKNYSNEDQNMIGATTSTTLRTVPVPGGDIAYVKKFGTDYAINDITNAVINTPRSVGAEEWTFTFYGWNGTAWVSMGSVQDAGGASQAFADGAAFSATKIKIILTRDNISYDVEDGDTINLTTNVDAPLVVKLSGEEGTAALTWYLSESGSTYYDESYMYGGYRHTPVLGSTKYPYFDIGAAYTAVATANDDGIEVLDSQTYDEELTIAKSGVSIYAKLGQAPTITNGIGARVTREVSTQYNNSSAIYFNKNGNDANNGKWQTPKLTIANAIANRGANNVVFGGANVGTISLFEEDVTMGATFTLESDYGYICIIQGTTNCIAATSGGAISPIVRGIKCSNARGVFGNSIGGITKCYDCIFHNGSKAFRFSGVSEIQAYRCISYNNAVGFNADNNNTTLDKCIAYNCNTGFDMLFSSVWTNCIAYDNSWAGFSDINMGTATNCLAFNNYYGFNHVGNQKNNIGYNNSKYDFANNGTITYSCWGTKDASITSGLGSVNEDSDLCWDSTIPYKYGISSDSPCYRTDDVSKDMGQHLQTITIGADDITLNGFIIDGQNQYNNAISIVDTDNDTGLNVKWCSIYDYQGIAIDLYDDDTDIDAEIKNCIINDNGNGIKLAYGGNTIEECIIYNNTIFGIHSDYTGQTFNHLVFYNNQYGIYFESNTSGIIIKNSIFHLNSLYGIYSEVSIIITYCCITGATNNVDISDASNIIDSPHFVNLDVGTENFHIKVIELGYFFNSPCKEAADDDKDIGAWDVNRATISDFWQKYESEFNPQVTWGNNLKGYITFINAEGSSDNYAKDSKRVFILDFGKRSQISSEMLRQKMEYFATLIKTRKNDIDDTSNILRFHQVPDTFHLSGSGVIDAAAKTLTHAQTLTENQHKGFHIGIKYSSGVATGTITAATKKLQVVPNPAWTDDEWIGYYVFHNGYYYYILDNDADELTLSDPDDTLENEANINWTIEKYFKIESNTKKGVFTLIDDDAELINGTYAYYINFIEVKIYTSKFNFAQPIFDFKKEHSKTGYKITLEEV